MISLSILCNFLKAAIIFAHVKPGFSFNDCFIAVPQSVNQLGPAIVGGGAEAHVLAFPMTSLKPLFPIR
jgi:hypothetical protein